MEELVDEFKVANASKQTLEAFNKFTEMMDIVLRSDAVSFSEFDSDKLKTTISAYSEVLGLCKSIYNHFTGQEQHEDLECLVDSLHEKSMLLFAIVKGIK